VVYEFVAGAVQQIGRFFGGIPRVFGWSVAGSTGEPDTVDLVARYAPTFDLVARDTSAVELVATDASLASMTARRPNP
jgi:hypothetical protein